MATLKEKTRAELERVVSELESVRDQVRLKLHLAGMEAKDRYAKIDDEIFELEQRAEQATESTADEVLNRLRQVRERLEKLRSRVFSA